MALKERRTVHAAIVSPGGVVTDLGRARFAFLREPRRDQVVRPGWTIATVTPDEGTTFEMPVLLAALTPEEPKGEWPCARGTLRLGQEAERYVADMRRAREAVARRRNRFEGGGVNMMPLYVDPERYIVEGLL